LALAEMKTLLAAIYQKYSTTLIPAFEKLSPTAVSRFELVYDDSFPIVEVRSTTFTLAARMNS
jgi:hypothetical protein